MHDVNNSAINNTRILTIIEQHSYSHTDHSFCYVWHIAACGFAITSISTSGTPIVCYTTATPAFNTNMAIIIPVTSVSTCLCTTTIDTIIIPTIIRTIVTTITTIIISVTIKILQDKHDFQSSLGPILKCYSSECGSVS